MWVVSWDTGTTREELSEIKCPVVRYIPDSTQRCVRRELSGTRCALLGCRSWPSPQREIGWSGQTRWCTSSLEGECVSFGAVFPVKAIYWPTGRLSLLVLKILKCLGTLKYRKCKIWTEKWPHKVNVPLTRASAARFFQINITLLHFSTQISSL